MRDTRADAADGPPGAGLSHMKNPAHRCRVSGHSGPRRASDAGQSAERALREAEHAERAAQTRIAAKTLVGAHGTKTIGVVDEASGHADAGPATYA